MVFIANGNIWKLKNVSISSPYLVRSNGTRTIGVTDLLTRTVYIAENLSSWLYNKVLLHELTHVYCFEHNVVMDMETEELVADFISLYGIEIVDCYDTIKGYRKGVNDSLYL